MDLKIEHLIVIALVGYILYNAQQPAAVKDTDISVDTDVCTAGCFGLSDSDLQIRQENIVNGTHLTGDVIHYLYSSDGTLAKASSTASAYPHNYATLPTCFNGYLMSGNDSGTYPDYYYTKTKVSWECDGTPILKEIVKVAVETETPSFTGYDDGTSESTWNITVGTSKVLTAELMISSATGTCIGNPAFDRPVGICINGSAATVAKFNMVKPTGVSTTFPTPSFMSNMGSVLGCYVLPTPALCDGKFYRFYLTIDPVSNPAAGEELYIQLMDKTYYENDAGTYVEGWEDVSNLATDVDIGITGSYATLNLN